MPTYQDALRYAVELHRNGRGQEAAELYRRIIRQQPDYGDPARLLALLLRHDDPPRAVALARQAVAIDPGLPWALSDLGLILKDAGREAEAGAALIRAARLAPLPDPALLGLADLYRAAGQPALALAEIGRILARQPDHLAARLAASRIVQDSGPANGGDDAAAIRWLHSVLACDPALLEGLFNLALTRHRRGETARAETHYRRIRRLRPDHPQTLLGLAQIWMLDGRIDDAEPALRQAAARLPGDDDINSRLARCRRYRAAMAAATAAPAEKGNAPADRDGLVVRGAFRDTSGYAHMVRRFVHGLADRALDVDLIDLNVDFVPLMAPEQRDPRLERLDRPVRARGQLTFAIPSIVEPVPGLLPVNFSMFEATPVPASWARHADRLACIIAPTESSRQAWLAAGVAADRLRLCPLGVDPVAAAPVACIDPATGRRLDSFRTRLLNVSDLVDRKNLAGLLRVWFRVTRPDDDAVLVLKPGKGHPDSDRRAAPFIDHIARSVGKSRDQAAPLFVLQGVLSDQQMSGVFAACTHYVSLSHGEGWDLPMTQAGTAGLTLIAPRHSAYETYLDDSVAHMIPARPAPALPPYTGLQWWDPDEDVAADILGAVIAGRAAPRSARDHLLTRFGWPAATDRLITVLREVGAL